jgi:hypothetical protein
VQLSIIGVIRTLDSENTIEYQHAAQQGAKHSRARQESPKDGSRFVFQRSPKLRWALTPTYPTKVAYTSQLSQEHRLCGYQSQHTFSSVRRAHVRLSAANIYALCPRLLMTYPLALKSLMICLVCISYYDKALYIFCYDHDKATVLLRNNE